jgi:hypothetical protein
MSAYSLERRWHCDCFKMARDTRRKDSATAIQPFLFLRTRSPSRDGNCPSGTHVQHRWVERLRRHEVVSPFVAFTPRTDAELSANRAAIQESDSRRGRGAKPRQLPGVSWLIPQELENLTLDYRALRTAFRVQGDITVAFFALTKDAAAIPVWARGV